MYKRTDFFHDGKVSEEHEGTCVGESNWAVKQNNGSPNELATPVANGWSSACGEGYGYMRVSEWLDCQYYFACACLHSN
jgi:hypothetical protein